MDSDDRKTVWLALMAVLFISAVVGPITSCKMQRDRLVAEAIAAGTDPIQARCAFYGKTQNSAACELSAAAGRKE